MAEYPAAILKGIAATTRWLLLFIGAMTVLLLGPLFLRGSSRAHAFIANTWWSGTCDDGNYYPYMGVHSYSLTSGGVATSYNGVSACGPLPGYSWGAPEKFPTSSDITEFEFQCAELASRYVYQQYGIHPYKADGLNMVDQFPISGTSLTRISNHTAWGSSATNNAPAPGDIISYYNSSIDSNADESGGDVGHVAIVTGSTVDSSGNGTLTLMEQNASSSGVKTESVSGWVVADYGTHLQVKNWLHNASPGVISVSSSVSASPANAVMGKPFSASYTVQNTGGSTYSLTSLDLKATTGAYTCDLGTNSVSSIAAGSYQSYSVSISSFGSGCSGLLPGSYTLTAWVNQSGGSSVIASGGGSDQQSITVSAPTQPTGLKLSNGNTEVFAINNSGIFLHNETVGTGPGGWSGWVQPLAQTATFTGRIWPVINSQGYEEVFARDTSGYLYRAYDSAAGWHSWQSFGSFQTVSDPSAIAYDSGGDLEMYALGSDGNIYHNWEGSFDSWSGFYSLGNGGASAAGGMWPVRNSAGKAEVFTRDTGGHISNDVSSSGGWSWHSFGSFQTSLDPTAIGYDSSGDLELYVTGSDGNIYHNWEGSLGSWSGFSSLGNGGTSIMSASAPVLNSAGRAQIAVRDTNYHVWTDAAGSGGWSGWIEDGTFQSLTDPTSVEDYGGNQNTLIEGFDGGIYQALFSSGSWGGITDLLALPSPSSYGPSTNQAMPLKLSGGGLELFNVSSIGQVMANKTSGSGPGGWSGWAQISPSTQGVPFTGRAWAVVNSQGYPEVFARDLSGFVWRTYGTSSGWHAWEQFSSFQTQSNPIAIPYDSGGDLALFLVGSDGAAYYYKETSFDSWVGYTQAPSASMAIGGGIWAVDNSAGNTELFARDTSGNIWYIPNPLNSSSSWSQVSSFQTPSDPTAVAYNSSGYLEMYVRGNDGNLYHSWETAPGTWAGLVSLGNGGTAFSGPAWPIVNSGRPELFIRDSSNRTWTISDLSGGWSSWSQIGTYQSLTDPIGVEDSNPYPEVFIEGNDGVAYQAYASSGSWSSWAGQGNPN